jgi:hypothetical protein
VANSSTTQTGITTLVQDNIGDFIVSELFARQVILYLLMRKNGDKQGVRGLGRPMVDGAPNTGVFVSGKGIPAPRPAEINGAYEYKPPIQYQELTDWSAEITSIHDNDTQVENWEDNQIESTLIRPGWRWSINQTPIEVSTMNLRMTKNAIEGTERKVSKAVGDIWAAHTKMALAQHCRQIQSRMIGSSTPSTTTDAPTSVTSTLWSRQYSIPSIIGSTSNNYAGIDRSLSANAFWRPNVNTTSQALNIRDMLNYARYSATTPLSNYGLYVDALIMGNDLFPSALAQMDALKGQVFYQGGFPDFPTVGYNRQVAIVDGTVAIINEPTWPAGVVAGLSLDTWFTAIHPDANFTASDPERQNKLAGGHRSVAANIETQWMYGCVWPAGNVYWSTVTA